MAFEAPCISQDILKQCLASAARLTVSTIVGAHHRLYLRFLYTGFKRRKISLEHILTGSYRIERMTLVFRTGVYREMLCTCCRFHVIVIVPLDSLDKAHTQTGSKVRVLTESFMAASPSRITENIYVGRPEGQPLVNIRIIKFLLHVEFCAPLCRHHIRHFLKQILIKSSRHSDCLRKDRRHTCPGYSVQRFIPPVVRLNAQARDRRCAVKGLRYLLLESHLSHQLFCPLPILFYFFCFHSIYLVFLFLVFLLFILLIFRSHSAR